MVAFGAHPDDVELSAGGTVARAVAAGKRVALVDLTRGELGTRGSAELREREAAAAADVLGVAHRENCGLPDGAVGEDAESLSRVVEVIRRLKPAVVLANALSDRHPDHGRAAALVAAAGSPPLDLPVTIIGTVTEDRGLVVEDAAGRREPLVPRGFVHAFDS